MNGQGKKRYVLLDRDGTLIEERHYLADPNQVVLISGVGPALRTLVEAGIGLVMLTNQSGIGRRYFDLKTLDAIHLVLKSLLAKDGVALDGIFVCPHVPEANCQCRKPRPGMALAAGKELGFDPAQTLVVGDKACDVELGKQLSAGTILVGTGHGTVQTVSTKESADQYVPSMVEASELILDWHRTGSLSLKEKIRYG